MLDRKDKYSLLISVLFFIAMPQFLSVAIRMQSKPIIAGVLLCYAALAIFVTIPAIKRIPDSLRGTREESEKEIMAVGTFFVSGFVAGIILSLNLGFPETMDIRGVLYTSMLLGSLAGAYRLKHGNSQFKR